MKVPGDHIIAYEIGNNNFKRDISTATEDCRGGWTRIKQKQKKYIAR
jgi:hypothetical protein